MLEQNSELWHPFFIVTVDAVKSGSGTTSSNVTPSNKACYEFSGKQHAIVYFVELRAALEVWIKQTMDALRLVEYGEHECAMPKSSLQFQKSAWDCLHITAQNDFVYYGLQNSVGFAIVVWKETPCFWKCPGLHFYLQQARLEVQACQAVEDAASGNSDKGQLLTMGTLSVQGTTGQG